MMNRLVRVALIFIGLILLWSALGYLFASYITWNFALEDAMGFRLWTIIGIPLGIVFALVIEEEI